MKNSFGILLPLLLVLGWTVGTVAAQERSDLPHGPLTRAEFVGAKTIASGLGDQKNGELGDAAVTSDRYDMLRMALDLRIDPGQRTIAGSVKMVFRSERAALDAFVFDLIANLDVTAVDHASGPLVFTHLADSVVVTLPSALALGTEDSLVVYYSGTPTSPVFNRGLMFKRHFPLPEVDQSQLVPIVANMSQPAYAQSWWPCKDRPDDKFRVSLALTVPDTLVGVSNGTLLREQAADPGWRTYSWREDYPIASYLVSVAISDYELLTSSCTTGLGSVVPLQNWVFPNDVVDAIADFAPLCDMLDFCETRFGPYPFIGEKYGHAEFLWPGAMEHQTVTSIGAGSLTGQGLHEWLIVHELGHQWFGDSLTPADWADIWLNEGFATYSEILWAEHKAGSAGYFTAMANAREPSGWIDDGPVYDPVPIFPGRVIYDKGAWILHMLRGRMGDPAFFGLVAEWSQGAGRKLGYVETQGFIDLAGVWAGEDLNAFLWPYLTTTALPILAFDYDLSQGLAGPDTHLQINLRQRQTPLFDNTYPVVVTTTAGQQTLTVNLSTLATVAEFELDAAVLQVELDPQQWLLWRGAGSTPQVEGLTRVFPNPSRGNYVVFRYRLERNARLQLRVYDVRGREVAARDLGRKDAGEYEWGWDVTGAGGEAIPSGVYWAALFVDTTRSVAKFSVVR
jgi:aminopeptidase N